MELAPRTPAFSPDQQAVSLWLATVAPASRRIYRAVAAEFLKAAGKPLAEVKLEDLAAWFESLPGRPNTQRRKQMTIKSLLSFCHRIGYLAVNAGLVLPARKAPVELARRILPRESLQRLMEAAAAQDREILEFLYETGVRAGEVGRLRWRDLESRPDGLGQVVVTGKGERNRTVLISAGLLERLEARRGAPDGWLFCGPRGGRLDQSSLWRMMRATARRAGLAEAVSAHWLRHACASHAIEGGAPLHLVQQQLGHTSLAVTGRYLHARPQDGLCRYLALEQGRRPGG